VSRVPISRRLALMVALAGALAALWLPSPALARGRAPQLSATAAIVIDARSGATLLARHATARRSIASTTKLMTAHLVLERARLRQVFTAPAYRPGPAESLIGLRKGERMTVHDLLTALLLPSANDAAWDLAYNVGGHSVGRFVRLMNREARRLGLRHTHYANPIGLDDPRNYSTASDLAKLAALDMRDRAFARIVDRSHATLKSGAHTRLVINRNDLVEHYGYVDGVKTGHTLQAGYVLVGAAHRGGASVISVVIGEPSVARRDADSIALLRWGLEQYRRVTPLRRGHAVVSVPIRLHSGRTQLAPARSFSLTVRRGTPVSLRFHTPERVKGPLSAGATAGRADVLADGAVVGSVPLVTLSKVPGPSLLKRLSSVLKTALIVLVVLLGVLACTLVALRLRVVRRQRASSAR
jgi:serine-type D-Ala-D-Ala carboxypeptidase (penicillin-binding protein 5/6)